MAMYSKKMLKLLADKLIEIFFDKYANNKWKNSMVENFLMKCEYFKLITVCEILTRKVTPQTVTRSFLASMLNPLYEQFLTYVASFLLQWRRILFPDISWVIEIESLIYLNLVHWQHACRVFQHFNFYQRKKSTTIFFNCKFVYEDILLSSNY